MKQREKPESRSEEIMEHEDDRYTSHFAMIPKSAMKWLEVQRHYLHNLIKKL